MAQPVATDEPRRTKRCCGELQRVEVDAVPQSRPDSDSGRPRRFVVDGGTVLGLALLLVVGWAGYVFART